MLFEIEAPQPPLKVAVANQLLNAVLIAPWPLHCPTVVFKAQLSVTAGAEVTVKVALHVTGGWHELVTVHVTVLLPPHDNGAPVLLLLNEEPQPPLVVTPANHAA